MKLRFLFLWVALSTISGASLLRAQSLPAIQLKDIKGKSVNTAELTNNGKPLIISFFALWCKPCMKELNAIEEVYEDWQKETGVHMIAVSIDDARNSSKVPSFVRAHNFEWTTLLDPNSDFKRAMGVNQIPHLFLLDGAGNIVWQHTSYNEGSEEEIYNQLIKLKKQ